MFDYYDDLDGPELFAFEYGDKVIFVTEWEAQALRGGVREVKSGTLKYDFLFTRDKLKPEVPYVFEPFCKNLAEWFDYFGYYQLVTMGRP